MNLADPELELVDPTPNVHSLFVHFDQIFFWTRLVSRSVVRWSKRMYSCAGICTYSGRRGYCDIALSEPLLKLRPRKDLVETLLHEMIHAFLFITDQDQDRDGHGPKFQAHMHRINRSAGLNISIYHDFHDEVELYLTHWWRCNGPCQTWKPRFGIVRRSLNKPPGPTDYWWNAHTRKCGGTFVKIQEPEKKARSKKTAATKSIVKPNADISKYITSTKKIVNNVPHTVEKPKPLKDCNSNNILAKPITKHGVTSFSPPITKPPPILFSGRGHTIDSGTSLKKSDDVNSVVRSIWANKQLPVIANRQTPKTKSPFRNTVNNVPDKVNPNKHKAETIHADSPPPKVKKIDDYFKTASKVLKDLYGDDYSIKITESEEKLVVTKIPLPSVQLVDCPVCNAKVSKTEINRHLDECLNKDVIKSLCQDGDSPITETKPIIDRENKLQIPIMIFKGETVISKNKINDIIDLEKLENAMNTEKRNKIKSESVHNSLDSNYDDKVKAIVKKIDNDNHVRKSDNFITPKEEPREFPYFGYLDSHLDDKAAEIKTPIIKIEPGTSKEVKMGQNCACCGMKVEKPIDEHLDECIAFSDSSIPVEGASTSFVNETIVIDDDDDDDQFDETLTFNATGTKSPCPCCMEMVESAEMNAHLDTCLS